MSKKVSKSLAKKALEKGISHNELKGDLKMYIDERYCRTVSIPGEEKVIKILNDHVYVFKGIFLITVMKLPNEYKSIVAKIKKRLAKS